MNQNMLLIKSLDPGAKLAYSEYTDKFYVSSSIEISNGYILSGTTEHREGKEQAVNAFLDRLKNLKEDEFIVTRYKGKYRREYKWNGAGFQECTRDWVLEAQR